MIQIQKRDGRIVDFDQNKIINAILAAFKSVDEELSEYAYIKAKNIADYIQDYAEKANHILTVEEIQDLVEHGLMSLKNKEIARAYISYRNARTIARGSITDNEVIKLLCGTNDYWNKENSNKDAKVVTTQRDYLAGITSTDIAKRFILPKEVVTAHEEGIIHEHKYCAFC